MKSALGPVLRERSCSGACCCQMDCSSLETSLVRTYLITTGAFRGKTWHWRRDLSHFPVGNNGREQTPVCRSLWVVSGGFLGCKELFICWEWWQSRAWRDVYQEELLEKGPVSAVGWLPVLRMLPQALPSKLWQPPASPREVLDVWPCLLWLFLNCFYPKN